MLLFYQHNCCSYANNEKMQTINTNNRETLARNINQFRRSIVREFVFNILRTFVDFDFSLPQLATLLLLDEEGELTIKQVTEILGRSVSATSRLLDQLVERGMVSRREDEHDRRAKRIAITEKGRMLIAKLEQRRADVQIAAIEYFSAEEQAEINRAMALLAEAGQRRRRYDHPESNTTQ
jgi:DNA-binding MarR family transcriptional regulator